MMEPTPPNDSAEKPEEKTNGTPKAASSSAEAPPEVAAEAPATAPDASTSPDAGKAEDGPPSQEKRLLPRGNPLRIVRGGTTALVGSFFAFCLMAHSGQMRWSVPLGTLFVVIASWGLLDLVGSFDDPDDRLANSMTLGDLGPQLGALGASFLLFCGALGLAQSGWLLPQAAWGVIVTLTFVAGVATVFELGKKLGAWKTDETGVDRPLWERHGFWVVVIAAALYFPFMGSYALWDPWETHYGEVAREMLARDDWISLWWAQDGWFWSKPVLDMWMQAIAMATLGTHYQPDKMLIGDGTKPVMHPEWAVRAPVVLLTIVGLYFLYKGVARTFGRRAGLLGALVLATMPDWFFIAHQTMTDMPFVGAMTACLGLVLIGLRTPEDATVRAYEVKVAGRRLRFTAWHLVFGAILLCAIPQILYLFSRNFELVWRDDAHGFRPHFDEFRSGSGMGNCGLPGNEDCKLQTSSVPEAMPDMGRASFVQRISGMVGWAFKALIHTVGFQPALQAVMWAVVLGLLLYLNWGERRARRLYYLAAWFFAAISTMGKGPAGFGLPILVVLCYLAASRPAEDFYTRLVRVIRELTQFEIVSGLILIIPVVALPWYIAMYVRHGSPFTDRLIFHDMVNRAFSHVHDTNEGDDTSFRFYIWQLGYALFPWTGLAPVGLLWWMRRGGSESDSDRADTSVLLCMWFVLGFALFSFMGTKFHHYIFPAVPPVAMLVGVVLDDMLGREATSRTNWRSLVPYLVGLALGLGVAALGVSRFLPGSFLGLKPEGRLADASPVIAGVLIAAGLGIVVACAVFLRPKTAAAAETSTDAIEEEAHQSAMLAGGAIAAALLLALVTRDLVLKPENSDQPGAIRLLQLFTYNYRRGWPESLDFSAALLGFGAVSVALMLAIAVRAVRKHAVIGMCTFAFVWALWGLDVYMAETAQHWGQHEIIAAYYADRASPEEILVAYQMNWKGENFYTGNHVPAFVSTGGTFTTWLKKKKDDGAKVMYFITEHGRIGGLKGEVGAKKYTEVTDKVLCNKFVLVRAEF
jgi:4-amino-4-deoxy-L-arabinose transferase-like glycosyltransferase